MVVAVWAGSPPPMRGKELTSSSGIQQIRITPAYAGKRVFCLTKEQVYKDHPRLCGEKRQSSGGGGRRVGSPPPMRGKVSNRCQSSCWQ